MKITGAQALMKALLKEKVDIIFGYPGGAIMPIYDALYDYEDQIHHVLVRHEQGAAHAAEGFARVTGKPGVCFATSGPGATNLVTGIMDAMIDSVPIVCITGQVAAHLVGTDAFQETDVIGITTPITKWNFQVTEASEIPEAIARAFYIAKSGRPGPVVIDITKNAQFETFEYDESQYPTRFNENHPIPPVAQEEIKKAAELLNNAKRPFILAGHGVLISKADQQLMEFSEKAHIPVATTLHGLSSFPSEHPNYVGMLGMHGNYGPNLLTNKADVIFAVGMRFDDRVTGRLKDYAKQAKIIHVEVDPAEINKNVRNEVSLVGDAKNVLSELIPHIQEHNHTEWFDEFKKLHTEEFEKVIKFEIHPTKPKLNMAEVVNALSEKTKGEAIVVADVGQHQMITARYFKFKHPDSFITSGGAGTMGFALPASIGAKFAAKDKDVIAIIGDGCFQMTIQELATIAQEELPVKIVILNNNYLGMVRQWQELFFEKRYSFVDLKNPDFVAVTKGFYIDAERVDKREDLDGALQRMLDSKKPYLLDIHVGKEDNVFPMIPSGASVEEVKLE